MGLTVSALERGLVRVFALSLGTEDARALSEDPAEQARLLGTRAINPDFVEVFALSDLDTLGLVGYLVEGNGIDPQSLAADRAKLAALEGWVLIAYSAAFQDGGCTLSPAPELTLIGTYAEPGVDWSSDAPLVSQAATGEPAPAPRKVSDAAMSGRIASLALLVLFLLTGLMIWIAA